MNKLRYLSQALLAMGIMLLLSVAASAQRGGRGGGGFHSSGGGGSFRSSSSSSFRPVSGNNFRPATGGVVARPSTFTPRYNGGLSRSSISVGIVNRGGYYNYGYRPGYSYGYHGGYYYYPSYRYRPIYYSPFSYSHFGPAFGFRLSILPFGYYPFYLGSDPYYYYDGIFYRPYYDNGIYDGYEVTQPPLGAVVKHLPSGAKATVINGQKYYELGGTFYKEEMSPKNKLQYVVVGTDGVINTVDDTPAPGDSPSSNAAPAPDQQMQAAPSKLTQLPANTKAVTINQQKYYLAPSGVYYQEVIDVNNNVSYQPVSGVSEGTAPNMN